LLLATPIATGAGAACAQVSFFPVIPTDQRQVGLELVFRQIGELRGATRPDQALGPPLQLDPSIRSPWALLRVGMTEEDVQDLLGRPDRIDDSPALARWYWRKNATKGGWIGFHPESRTVTEWRFY
jgi:hypothetical protein